MKSVKEGALDRQLFGLQFRAVAPALDHDHRAIRPAQRPHIFQPVTQRLITKDDALVAGLGGVFEIRVPHRQKNRPRPQEQRVRAVINILPPKVVMLLSDRGSTEIELRSPLFADI
jgi:hypothetical protein